MATRGMPVAAPLRAPALARARPRPEQLEVLAFLAVALLAGWPIMLAAPTAPAVAVAAWVPGIAALALTRMRGSGGVRRRLGLDRLGWPDAYLVAIWVPVLFAAARILAAVALGNGRLDADVGGLHPASGGLPDSAAVTQVVAAILVAPLANMAVTVGSELGWRAYLLPRLLPLGPRRAVTLTSLAWAAWQAPLVVDPSAERWPLEAAAFLVWCLLVGEILGWLWLRTRSVWAPALFSGAIGATSFLPGLVLRDVAPDALSSVGPLALIGPAIVVLVIRSRSREDPSPL